MLVLKVREGDRVEIGPDHRLRVQTIGQSEVTVDVIRRGRGLSHLYPLTMDNELPLLRLNGRVKLVGFDTAGRCRIGFDFPREIEIEHFVRT